MAALTLAGATPPFDGAAGRVRLLVGGEFTSMAPVPMASRPSGLVGVLTVHTRSRQIFTERDVALLTTIGFPGRGADPSGAAGTLHR